ncbi:MAG: DUF2029 domain-containing protein [Cryobacterium sp.]|nr:DUF2029 domain-containing protein [Oligoflexia bacterium]
MSVGFSTLVAVIGAVFFGWMLIRSPMGSRWLDFPVYWEAGRKAIQGLTVYDVQGHFQYKYSPFIALLFGKAFSSVSFQTASWVYQKATLFAWVGIFIGLSRGSALKFLLLLLYFGNALKLDLALGQMNAWVLILLLALFTEIDEPKLSPAHCSFSMRFRKDILFGLLFSFAVQLKLFALVLIPLLLLRREYRKIAFGLLSLPLLSIGGYALSHGFQASLAENSRWLSSLSSSTDVLLLSPQNVGLLGTASKIFGLLAGKAVWGIIGIGFLFALYRGRSRSNEWFRNRLLFAIAFFNPLVWSYWILFTMPLFVEKISRLQLPRPKFYRIAFVFTALFVFAAFVSQHATWAWQGGLFAALAILGVFDPAPLTPADHEVFSRSP